jgi:hypothetical protein
MVLLYKTQRFTSVQLTDVPFNTPFFFSKYLMNFRLNENTLSQTPASVVFLWGETSSFTRIQNNR